MKEKIIYISEPSYVDEEIYKEYARKKIKVVDSNRQERYEYLDNPNTENLIETYRNYLSTEKKKITSENWERTFKTRMLANVVAFALSFGELLLISGITRMIENSAMLTSGIVSNIGFYLTAMASLATFWKMNNKKNYYNKKQLEKLEKLDRELSKCNYLGQEFVKTKENNLENEYQRLQIDNSKNRERNIRRNYNLKQEEKRQVMESNERVRENAKVAVQRQQQVIDNSKYRRSAVNRNLRLYEEDLERYRRSKLTKTNNFKRVLRTASDWVIEGFVDEPEYENSSRRR